VVDQGAVTAGARQVLGGGSGADLRDEPKAASEPDDPAGLELLRARERTYAACPGAVYQDDVVDV
jgi:hypothetical protein